MWITSHIGTDIIPMLANLCSKECEADLPKPPKNYVQFPHKGGADLVQPADEDELWEIEIAEREKEKNEIKNTTEQSEPAKDKIGIVEKEKFNFPLIKLVRKIWEK